MNQKVLLLIIIFQLEFMRQYGYLEPKGADSESLYSDLAVEDAVKDVQRFGGIPETGIIDNTTLEVTS